MKLNKKQVRSAFRKAVLDRDKHRCRTCGITPEDGDDGLDSHHIMDRNEMPGGGYVIENGITLCKKECHLKAEAEHNNLVPEPGFSRAELYALIGSSLEKARKASEKLA